MSQQKSLIVVCFLAGAVALVSGQSLNWQKCSSIVQGAADNYRKEMMNIGQSFTSSLQNAGVEASDISSIQSDIDKMTDSISKLTDMSNGVDMGRVTSVYLENLSTMASIARKSMRPQIFTSMAGAYMDVMNNAMAANTKFMETITENCMPSSRRYKPRQTV